MVWKTYGMSSIFCSLAGRQCLGHIRNVKGKNVGVGLWLLSPSNKHHTLTLLFPFRVRFFRSETIYNQVDSPWFLGGGTAGLGRSGCRGSLRSSGGARCWCRARFREPPCSCGWCRGISSCPVTNMERKSFFNKRVPQPGNHSPDFLHFRQDKLEFFPGWYA